MKKLFLSLVIAAAAVVTLASCEQKPDTPPEPEIPTSVDANFTSLVKGDVISGEVNAFPVSASAEGAQLELTFYASKPYIPTGTYKVGTAEGNYTGRYKNSVIDSAIKSGEITVNMAGDGDYTFTGTLRLDNEAGTIVKLNASGQLAYEIPTEYYYTIEKGKSVNGVTANVYKIYDLENHPIAEASVVGAEEGEFTVADKTLVAAAGDAGTWVNVDDYGVEAYLHGKVTVSTSFGKKTFKFEDNHTVTLANCELKSSITPAYEDPGLFSWGFFTYNTVKSPVLKDKYETTIKLFYRLEGDVRGPEFLSTTIITSDDDLIMHNLAVGVPSTITTYAEYADYTESELFEGRIAPDGASFFFSHGVKTAFKPSAVSGKYMVLNCQEMAPGYFAIVVAPIDMAYAGPEELLEVLANGDIYSCMGATM